MALDPSTSLIRGLQASIGLDGTTISVSPGVCYIPETGRILSDGMATVTLSGGLPNTFYHLYAYQGANGLLDLEISTTAPDLPYLGSARCKTGDTTRRYLISGRTGATGILRPGRHVRPTDYGNRVMLDAASAAGSVPVNLLNLFTSTTPQTIDLSNVIPITATRAVVQVLNPSTRTLYVGRGETGTVSNTNYQYAAVGGSSPVFDVTLNTNRTFTCVLSATDILGGIIALLTGSVMINLVGYEYDR